MTNVIILSTNGQQKNKIVFTHQLCGREHTIKPINGILCNPSDWANVELVAKNYGGVDLMYVYDVDRNESAATFFLGHWNDGIV